MAWFERRTALVAIALGLLPVLVDRSNGDTPPTPQLHCTCVLATSGCPSKLFDELAGKPRHDWFQDFTPPNASSNTTHARALACWRKRDADKLGDGLCCSLNGDDSDADRYFRGNVDPS
jgi:hypothetical protein